MTEKRIETRDDGRANKSGNRAPFISVARRIFVAFTACLLAAGCSGVGQGYKEPIDYRFGGLGVEMNIALNRVFRPDLSSMRMLATREYGDPKRYAFYRNATIPWGHAHIDGRDMCNRRQNPYCKGMTFGEELLDRPDVIAAMTDWLTHLCERLPVTVTDPGYYVDVKDRQRDLDRLRTLFQCDSKTKEARDFQYHVYIVRDLDNVFGLYPPQRIDAVLRQSVIRHWVIKINQ